MSRILFHIADAPCHGSRFHSDCGDDYPSGDPRGLDITDLIKQIISKNVCYYFAEINKSTLKMIEEFETNAEVYIYEYFEDIKIQVDLRREVLKQKIDDHSDEIIKSENQII